MKNNRIYGEIIMKNHGRLVTWKSAFPTVALLAAICATPASAATVTFNLDTVFSSGAVAPDGPAPYATLTLDDGGGTGTVVMTASVSGDVGAAYLEELYLNFDPAFSLANLIFTHSGGDGPGPSTQGNNGIFTGVDAFQSDGDGKYDIYFNFPPPPGNGNSTFDAGETVIYTITSSDAITASSFNFLSAEGGGEGTYLAASKFNATGPSQGDSAWVGASPIPVPAAVWLFGSGLIGLVCMARRKKAS